MSDQRATDASDEPVPHPTDAPTQEAPVTYDDAPTQEVPPTDHEAAQPEPFEAGAATATSTVATPRRGIRSGTVVWGLVLAVVGVGLLAWSAGVEFDVQLALIVLIGVAGVALLATSVASVRRRRDPRPGA